MRTSSVAEAMRTPSTRRSLYRPSGSDEGMWRWCMSAMHDGYHRAGEASAWAHTGAGMCRIAMPGKVAQLMNDAQQRTQA